MTRTRKTNRTALRSLDAAELRSVSGGIILLFSTSLGGPDTTGAVGNPEDRTSTSFTGGVAEALPAIQR